MTSSSADELRSVNGQVEYILRQAVRQRKKEQREEDIDGGAGGD